MPSLADLQHGIARAMTTGERDLVVEHLTGGTTPRRRLDIHLRHYEASLTACLRDKFAACIWLAGAGLVESAARAYVHAYPPRQLCIAEYGDDFPRFLASYGRAPTMPYLESFATLEWAVGQASIAIDHPPLSWPDLAQIGVARLVDSGLELQPGLRYVRSSWGVDELMTTYLRGTEPERFVLAESATFIEVRGQRGSVQLARLAAAAFAFRRELAAGASIGAAAGGALDHDAAFDPGEALQSLVTSGLAVNIVVAAEEQAP